MYVRPKGLGLFEMASVSMYHDKSSLHLFFERTEKKGDKGRKNTREADQNAILAAGE